MTAMDTRLGHADAVAAAQRIADHVRRTPLLTADTVPGVLLKGEHLQRSGSFKARGAANAMLALGATEVVTGSSGNHGIAVATLARSLGVRVTVVMAAGASPAKAEALRALGAQVLPVDGGNSERDRFAREHAESTGATHLPSANHELVVAGQGTAGLEILDDEPDVDIVYVPTGGGGLLAGVCLAFEHLPRVRVVGVEPMDARRYALSLTAGRPVEVPPPTTIADGLRAQRPGEVPFSVIRRRVDEMVTVGDDAIEHAMGLLHRGGVMAEASGSIAVAAALEHSFPGRTVALVSGGNTPEALAARLSTGADQDPTHDHVAHDHTAHDHTAEG